MSSIQHIDFYNNPKLLVLDGAHSPLSAALFYLPSKDFTSLGLANNELFNIPMILNYVVADTLERLNLSGNFLLNLGTFNINMFPGMREHLRFLILKRSNIRNIEDNAFKFLERLEYINLSENQLRSVPEALKLPNLKHLDLSYQCYTWICDFSSALFKLNETSFEGMESLSVLDIRGVLGRVDKNSFVSAPYLEELDVSSVILTEIDKDAFVHNPRLKKLTCYQCWLLMPLHVDLFTSLPNLEYLDLSYSPHSIIGDNSSEAGLYQNVPVLQNLRVLNLTCSLVLDHTMCDKALYQYESPLDPNLLTPLTMLETLEMGKNGLTSWNERRFVNNLKLKKLSIQYNKFKSLTKAMMDDFRNLEYLDIRMNEGDYLLCDMQVVDFYYWVIGTHGNVTIKGWNNGHSYFCDDVKYHKIRSFKEFGENHDMYPVPGGQGTTINSLFSEGLTVGLSTMGVILVLFISVTYRKRFFISFWLMRQRKKYKYREKKDSSFVFDVFISYSQDDHEWVINTLLPELEVKEPKLKVCIHERDFRVS